MSRPDRRQQREQSPANGDHLGSVRASVGIRRSGGTEADGAEFIGYWSNAILADLTAQWNAATAPRIREAVPPLARSAHRWFTSSWRAARGTPRSRYEITEFRLYVFSLPRQQGAVLAEVDVLTGRYSLRSAA